MTQPPYGPNPQSNPPTSSWPAPAYGQPSYGQPASPGYGGPVPYGYPGAAKRPAPSIPGLVVAVVGAVCAVVGFFAPWYSANGVSSKLKDLAAALKPDGAPGLAHLWFSTGGLWVVFGLTAIAAFLAVMPIGAAQALRFVAPVLGLLGVVMTFAALSNALKGSGRSPFDHAAIGLFMMLLGFLVVGAGGAFGGARR